MNCQYNLKFFSFSLFYILYFHWIKILHSQDSTLVEGDEAGLEEILDQLLEEGAGGGRTQQHRDSVAATVTYVIDHDPPMDTDDTLHDSRMVTHSESQVSRESNCDFFV